MKVSASVLSVDPGKKSIGVLHPEAVLKYIPRHRVLNAKESSKKTLQLRNTLNILFGVHGKMPMKRSVMLLIYRLAFAGIIMLVPLMNTPEVFKDVPLWGLWTGAAILAIGLGHRIIMGATSASLLLTSILIFVQSGSVDGFMVMASLFSLALAISGPGRISVDTFLRRGIYWLCCKRHTYHRQASQRLSYRALHYAE